MTLNEYGESPAELGTFVSGSLDEYGNYIFGTEQPATSNFMLVKVWLNGAWQTMKVRYFNGTSWSTKKLTIL